MASWRAQAGRSRRQRIEEGSAEAPVHGRGLQGLARPWGVENGRAVGVIGGGGVQGRNTARHPRHAGSRWAVNGGQQPILG